MILNLTFTWHRFKKLKPSEQRKSNLKTFDKCRSNQWLWIVLYKGTVKLFFTLERYKSVNKYLLSKLGLKVHEGYFLDTLQIPKSGNKMMAPTVAYKMQQRNLRRVMHLLGKRAEESPHTLGKMLIFTEWVTYSYPQAFRAREILICA